MADTRRLTIEILGDAKNGLKALDDVGDKARRIGEGLMDFGKKVGIAFAAIGAAGAVIGKELIDSASDLNEVTSKTDVIFGDASDAIKKFAENAAVSFGQSQTQALNAASSFGVFGKAAGLTGDDLADFSIGLSGLASDLASFSNTSPEDAALALGAALRGESEPIRRYGVMLDDATLKAKAMELGIYDGNGALTQQQKILAAQASILEQTSDAQGDFARTSDGVANQQRILAAQFDNVKSQLGQALLPAFAKVLGFVNDKVMPGFASLAETFKKDGLEGVIDKIQEKLPAIREKLQQLGSAMWEWIKDVTPVVLAKVGELMAAFGAWLVETGLPWVADKLQEGAKALWAWIEDAVPPALEKLGELIAKLANWLLDEGLPMLVDKLIELGNALVDWIKPRIAPAIAALAELLVEITKWIITTAVPKLAEQAIKLGAALIGWVVDVAPDVIKGLGEGILKIIAALPGLFVDLLKAMFNIGKDIGSRIIEGVVDGFGKLLGAAGDLATKLKDAFVNALKGGWNLLVAKPINAAVRAAVDALDTSLGPFVNFDDPPNIIPQLAEGGIVTAPTLALIGEAGPEAVVPLSKAGSLGGSVVQVTVQGSVISEGDLLEKIRVGLLKAQKNGRQVVLAS